MTILTSALNMQILTLREGKVGPAKIARIWNIDSNTSHRSELVAGLPPKDKLPKHNYSGRNGGLVRRYLEDYPMARLDDIIAACDLPQVHFMSIQKRGCRESVQRETCPPERCS
jgi:hypothetical protein